MILTRLRKSAACLPLLVLFYLYALPVHFTLQQHSFCKKHGIVYHGGECPLATVGYRRVPASEREHEDEPGGDPCVFVHLLVAPGLEAGPDVMAIAGGVELYPVLLSSSLHVDSISILLNAPKHSPPSCVI